MNTATIQGMSPEARRLLRIYGDHARGCAWRRAVENIGRTELPPDCDCGWLEVLREACGQGPLTAEQIKVGQQLARARSGDSSLAAGWDASEKVNDQ